MTHWINLKLYKNPQRDEPEDQITQNRSCNVRETKKTDSASLRRSYNIKNIKINDEHNKRFLWNGDSQLKYFTRQNLMEVFNLKFQKAHKNH